MSEQDYADRTASLTVPHRIRPDQRLGLWYQALYGLVLVCLVLLNALVVFDAGTQNHQALQSEKRTLSAILNARLAALAADTADNAVWTEAYQHLVVRFDPTWMAANYNDSFYKSFGADRLVLLAPDDRVLEFLYQGKPASPRESAVFIADPDLKPLIVRARSLRPDPSTAASGFLVINGQLNLAGVCQVAPNDPALTIGQPHPGVIFVLTTIVDDAFLASVPADYGLHRLHLLSKPVPPDSAASGAEENTAWDGWRGLWEPAVLVVGPAGHGPNIAIAWKAHRPGDKFLRVFLPPILFLSILVAIFGVIVIRHLQSNTRQLAGAYAAAAAGSDAKSRFLAMMSHELRTPLNSVIGFAEMMANELFGPLGHDKYREYAAHIRGSGAHLLAIVNDLLDLSALTSGELTLREKPFDLNATITATLKLLGPLADRAGVRMGTALCADEFMFVGDEQRITQVLLNLLSNAIKFTPGNGHVDVSTRIDLQGRCVVAVSDTGIGISDADIPKALELFGQIDNDLARRYEGTGLGLPLADLLVALHGGKLEISGIPGVGTTVSLIFPAVRVLQSTAASLHSVA